MNPQKLRGLRRNILPAMDIGAPVEKRIAGMQDIGRIVVEAHFHDAGEHIDQLFSVVCVRRQIAAAGLDHAKNRVHRVFAHGNQRIHFKAGIAFKLNGLSAAFADEAIFLRRRLHKVQRALPIEVRQLIEHIQRNIAAVFQLAQMRHGDTDRTADLFEGVALLLSDLTPLFADELLGVKHFFLLLHVRFQRAVPGTAAAF